ncbi:hypothetical protein BC830DRAFT_740563 [Chytriomyces sp. MP71]|nr:hypothetical protein BC830DRAFT_740563 [Chytriomyces sp. MP71]
MALISFAASSNPHCVTVAEVAQFTTPQICPHFNRNLRKCYESQACIHRQCAEGDTLVTQTVWIQEYESLCRNLQSPSMATVRTNGHGYNAIERNVEWVRGFFEGFVFGGLLHSGIVLWIMAECRASLYWKRMVALHAMVFCQLRHLDSIGQSPTVRVEPI